MKNPTKTTSNNSISITKYPASLCRIRSPKNGLPPFRSVSFLYQGKWGTFPLKESLVSNSRNSNGIPISGKLDLNLGDPDHVRLVSLPTDDGSYRKHAMTNSIIRDAILEDRRSYFQRTSKRKKEVGLWTSTNLQRL